MWRNGAYEIVFGTWKAMGRASVTMTDGRFEGVTDRGTRLTGICKSEPERARFSFEMEVHIPPYVETVTDIVAGPSGRIIATRGEIPGDGEDKRFSIDLAGRAVDISLRYLGPHAPGD